MSGLGDGVVNRYPELKPGHVICQWCHRSYLAEDGEQCRECGDIGCDSCADLCDGCPDCQEDQDGFEL